MRSAVLGALLSGLVVAVAFSVLPRAGYAERMVQSGSPGGVIALTVPVGSERQQVTVIDPDTRTMSVYHVELSSGEISLKSVRNIHWDLQLMEFNGTSPLPREVRAILEQR